MVRSIGVVHRDMAAGRGQTTRRPFLTPRLGRHRHFSAHGPAALHPPSLIGKPGVRDVRFGFSGSTGGGADIATVFHWFELLLPAFHLRAPRRSTLGFYVLRTILVFRTH